MTKTKEEVITLTNEQLLAMIEERQSYKHLIDEAEAIVKKLDTEIKKIVEDSGSHSVIVGTRKVSLSKYTRESVSVEAVRELLSQKAFEQVVTRKLITRLNIQ